jgi:hypothetical protein
MQLIVPGTIHRYTGPPGPIPYKIEKTRFLQKVRQTIIADAKRCFVLCSSQDRYYIESFVLFIAIM